MPALASLQLFADPVARGGPEQMALDEALLETVTTPLLRSYRWKENWVSFGYSQSAAAVATDRPAARLVRRWTGGGIVDHDGDWTFSLIVPRGDVFAGVRPADSYCAVHRAVMAVLERCGGVVQLAPQGPSGVPGACFAGRAAEHDVLDGLGAKLCGGAQRRTRAGILHQGSVRNTRVPADFLMQLGRELAGNVCDFEPIPGLTARMADLVKSRYGDPLWTQRIA